MSFDKKRLLKTGIIAFVVLETTSVIIGVWPYFFPPENSSELIITLRLGIIPNHSKRKSRTIWEPTVTKLTKDSYFHIMPYYSNSYEEAIYGILSGSLDLLLVNSVVFEKMKDKFEIKPILLENLQDNVDDNRTVLVCRSDLNKNYISQTKGLKISFVDQYSLSGFLTANDFLKKKINVPVEEWFSKVSYAGTHHQALLNLISGLTDVISVNYLLLKHSMNDMGYAEDSIQILWMSQSLPESVLCGRSDLDEIVKKNVIKLLENFSEKNPANQVTFRQFEESYYEKMEKFAYLGKNVVFQ